MLSPTNHSLIRTCNTKIITY